MNIREHLFTFSGLIFCLFQFCLAQEFAPKTAIINVEQRCLNNSTVNLEDFRNAILEAKGFYSLDCEIILGKSEWKSIVISLYECDLEENDELVFRDRQGTVLSLTGTRRWSGVKTFIFKSPLAIHYATNATSIVAGGAKLKFVFTETHGFMCMKDEFQCTNKQCIPNYLVCDNHDNCGDGSDETDCHNQRCSDYDFKCANTKCIPKYKLCNDRNDCGDFSDEKDCNQDCEIRQQYKCDNTRCISNLFVCDNQNDCGDWSDETNCYLPCDSSKFLCNNNKCIDSWKVCNRIDDCGDRSDEKNCRACSSSEFRCSNRKCIPRYFVCNNRDDCGDFSDEKGCNTADKDSAYQRKVTVVEVRNPWIITIIVCAVVLAIVVITFAAIAIRNKIKKGKKPPTNQLSNASTNNSSQNTQPQNLFGRVRQSFRLGRQSTPSSIQPPDQIQQPPAVPGTQAYQAPPMYPQQQSSVENSNAHQVPPPNSLQSFRPGHQSVTSHTETSPVASGVQIHQASSMYPHLQSGVDNPEFRIEE